MVRELANDAGSTPLHKAASIGNLNLVRWLLDHGAAESLLVRNTRGNTPSAVSRLYGPFPEVEMELARAEIAQYGASRVRPKNPVLKSSARSLLVHSCAAIEHTSAV